MDGIQEKTTWRGVRIDLSSLKCPQPFVGRTKTRSFKSLQSNEREKGGFLSTSITRQDVWSIGETTSTENFADHRHTVESRKKTTPWIKASEPCIRNYLISFIRIHPHPRSLLYRSRVLSYSSRIFSPLKRVHRRQIGSPIPREYLDKTPLKPATVKWRCPTISPAKQQGKGRTRTLVERSYLL